MASRKSTETTTAETATAASSTAPRAATATAQIRAVSDIRFDALRNAIYHSARRGFLDFLNRCLSFVVVLGGAGAVAVVGGSLGISPAWFAALAATAGLLQLVFDFGGRARDHEFLQKRYYELVAEVAECEAAGDSDCLRWDATLNRLYADEPPPMRALDAISYNAVVDNLGYEATGRLNIKWNHSLFRNVWPFDGTSFEQIRERSR